MMRLLTTWSCALSLAAAAIGQGEVSFERDVLPVLRAKCFKCHSAPKTLSNGKVQGPKGGLRLDGRAFFALGGDGEEAVVPGEPEESGIYRRTMLPLDDPDFMPSKGTPLTDDERELVRRWIAAGADYGTWEGASADGADTPAPATEPAPAVVPERITRLRALGAGLAPVSATRLAKLAGETAQVTTILPDVALLRVSFRAAEPETDDARLAAFTRVGAHVAYLELARTRVTDRATSSVSKMPRLTRLDVSHTAVGDAFVRGLGACRNLRSLNLVATNVTDASIAALAKLESLERLYVWQSKITESGIAELRAKRPALRIHGAPVWPVVEPPRDDRPRRRRG